MERNEKSTLKPSHIYLTYFFLGFRVYDSDVSQVCKFHEDYLNPGFTRKNIALDDVEKLD